MDYKLIISIIFGVIFLGGGMKAFASGKTREKKMKIGLGLVPFSILVVFLSYQLPTTRFPGMDPFKTNEHENH